MSSWLRINRLSTVGALPSGYSVLPSGTKIAAETATTRGQATPIYYQLKVSQNGLLSLPYALCPAAGCGAWQTVLSKLETLTPPSSVATEFNTLKDAASRVEADLNAVVSAAATHDASAAAQASHSLVQDMASAKAAAQSMYSKLGIS